MKLSIFGSTGFIGSNFVKLYPDNIKIKKGDLSPQSNDILYFISTVDNYNVFSDLSKDVKVNLELLCQVLDNCKSSQITFNFISSWFVMVRIVLYQHLKMIFVILKVLCDNKKMRRRFINFFCKTFGVKYRL